jgi:tetratricopeptide (TPR) repeat protein
VRQAALLGLGLLGDNRAADTIANALNDPDANVRLRAVEALSTTASPAHAEQLWQRMDPQVEMVKAVRDQAWKVLQSLFAKMPKEHLGPWADRFRGMPERRLSVLLALRDQLVRDKDEQALAANRQNIGATYMDLHRPADAAPYFKMALDYYRERGVRNMVTEGLVGDYMQALLESKKYAEACRFAAESIAANPTDQPTMGSKIRQEVERLRDEERFADAMALLDEAAKMTPPLDTRYSTMLNSIREDIRRRQNEQGNSAQPAAATNDVNQ